MKHFLLTPLFLLMATPSTAQVIIGDAVGTAEDKTSVLLEFSKENKGLILPYVRTKPTNAVGGTLLFDRDDSNVKFYNGTAWVKLTDDTHHIPIAQPDEEDRPQSGVVITRGDVQPQQVTADGVLVLESYNKALVLPHISSTDDILNPSPGMLAYLKPTRQLVVFSGTHWAICEAVD